MSHLPSRPELLSYRDPVLYLNDYFHCRKAHVTNGESGSFSLRKWAGEMGFESSRTLDEILKGKRPIKLKQVELIENGVSWSDRETLYFKAIVQLSHAKSDEERHLIGILVDQVAAQFEETILKVENPEVFSHWVHSAILELCKLRALDSTEEKICALFEGRLDRETLSNSVGLLVGAGLLERTSEGILRTTGARIRTANEVSHLGARKYFQQVSELAKDASELSPQEREFQCFSIGLRREDLPAVKDLIRKTRAQLSAHSSEDGDVIYQANLQFFPVLEGLGLSEGTLKA